MSKLSELKPEKKERVCDLLERAGIKVPINKNRFFMSLPAFNQPKIVVINFWYEKQIKQQGENIIVKWHLPTTTKEASPRMQRVHDAIKSAIEKNLKIRIIVLDGEMATKGSKVFKRSLDPMAWSVKTYNEKTGKCVLMRDVYADNVSTIKKESAVDDLSDAPEGNSSPDRAKRITQVIERDPRVRAFVIKRAKGKCEHCGVQGFTTTNGGSARF
jgi:predicted HNH restriction endonuclease